MSYKTDVNKNIAKSEVFFTNKIFNKLKLRQPIFLVFDKKSPKSEKIQSWKKVIFDAKNQKYRPPDLYRRILKLKF